jgi:4-amino-4-deoxy-L-arabinose transferase-like glycosyltransferase
MNVSAKGFQTVMRFIPVIGLFVLVRTFFIFHVPATWDPSIRGLQAHDDELSHVHYVQFLLKNHRMPVQNQSIQDRDAFKRNEFEYFQPPLSYAMVALAAEVFAVQPEKDGFIYFCRAIAAVWGLLSVILIYRLIRNKANESTALFLLLIYSLLPVHVRHSSSFSNDSMVWALSLVLFILIVRRYDAPHMKWRFLLLEGFVFGLALWTKLTALLIGFYYLLMVALQSKRRRNWLIPLLVGVLLSAPYFIRNAMLYHDPFGVRVGHGPDQLALSSLQPSVWFHFVKALGVTFVFPYDTVQIPFLFRLPAYVAWLSIFLYILFVILKNTFDAFGSRRITLETSFGFMILLFLFGMIGYNRNHLQAECRLVFHAVPAAFLIMSSKTRTIQAGWKAVLLVMVVYPLVLVLSA